MYTHACVCVHTRTGECAFERCERALLRCCVALALLWRCCGVAALLRDANPPPPLASRAQPAPSTTSNCCARRQQQRQRRVSARTRARASRSSLLLGYDRLSTQQPLASAPRPPHTRNEPPPSTHIARAHTRRHVRRHARAHTRARAPTATDAAKQKLTFDVCVWNARNFCSEHSAKNWLEFGFTSSWQRSC